MAEQVIDNGGAVDAASTETAVASGGQSENPKVNTETDKQVGQPSKQDVLDWAKDERFERMWKKDPNGLYKSYKELEGVYNPLKEKYSGLEQQVKEVTEIFKEFGVDPSADQIKSVLGELKTLKDPENLTNKRNDFLGYWLDDEVRLRKYGSKIDSFFNDLQMEDWQERFPNMSSEQIKRQMELEKKVEGFERQREYEKASETLNKGIDRITKYCDKVGFKFTPDLRNKFLDYCMQSGVPTNEVYYKFIDTYGEQLEKSFADKVKQEQLQDLNKNKQNIVPNASPVKTSESKEKFSFKEQARKLFT